MSWPLPHEFNEAMQNANGAFSDPDLAKGEAICGPTGMPLPRSGNFADVYQFHGAGKDWAVKCFTRSVPGLDKRYEKLTQALAQARLPFTIPFSYVAEGIRIGEKWFPIVKMEWVDGLQLNQFVRENLAKPTTLDGLLLLWTRVCKRLREAGLAHADIQHGNVLLVQGSKPGQLGIKLIDYDGMYVPALANVPSGELGHPAYQHPARILTKNYSPDLDRFPHLVIATAIKALSVRPDLWDRYDTGDNLLFVESDFQRPAESKLIRELWATNHPTIQELVGRLVLASFRPIPQTPWLDQIFPEGKGYPLTPEEAQEVFAVLSLLPQSPPPMIPATPPVPEANREFGFDEPEEESDLEDIQEIASQPKGKRGTGHYHPIKANGPAKKTPNFAILAGIGGLLALLLVGGIALLMFGKSKKPDLAKTPAKPTERSPVTPVTPVKTPSTIPTVIPPANPPEEAPPELGQKPMLATRWKQTIKSEGFCTHLGFTPGGDRLVAAFQQGENPPVVLLDSKTGAETGRFQVHPMRIVGLAPFAPNMLSLNFGDPFALAWNPADAKILGKVPVPMIDSNSPLSNLFASPDAKWIAVWNAKTNADTKGKPSHAGKVTIHNAEGTSQVWALESQGAYVRLIAGDRAVIAEDDGRVRMLTLAPTVSEKIMPAPEGYTLSFALAVSPDGSIVVYAAKKADTPNETACAFDSNTGQLLGSVPLAGFAKERTDISPDGQWFALHAKNQLAIVSTKTWGVESICPGPKAGRVRQDYTVKFSPDSTAIAWPVSRDGIWAFELPRSEVAVKPAVPKPVVPVNPPTPPTTVEPPNDTRLAVPVEAKVKEITATIRQLYKADYAKKTSVDRKAFAAILTKEGDEAKKSDEKYVYFLEAKELLADAGAVQDTFDAIRKLAEMFRFDPFDMKCAAFEKLIQVLPSANIKELFDLAVDHFDDKYAQEEFDDALKYAQFALAAARKSTVLAMISEAQYRVDVAKKADAAYDVLKPYLTTLKGKPTDPEANFQIGKYRCLFQRRWDDGLPLLAKGSDPAYQAAAELDLKMATAAELDPKVAEGWWELAKNANDSEKFALEARGRYWHFRIVEKLDGIERRKAEAKFAVTVKGIEYKQGLAASFFLRVAGVQSKLAPRVDKVLDFKSEEWVDTNKKPVVFDGRWVGVILPPIQGRYKIFANTMEPVRVTINGVVVIDTTSKKGTISVPITLTEKPNTLVVDASFVSDDGRSLTLQWQPPGATTPVTIPADYLYHAGGKSSP